MMISLGGSSANSSHAKFASHSTGLPYLVANLVNRSGTSISRSFGDLFDSSFLDSVLFISRASVT
jgi:hypothetical protein